MGHPGYPPPPPGHRRPGPPRPPGQPPDEGFWGRQVRLGLDREARQLRRMRYLWPLVLVFVICMGGLAVGGWYLRSRLPSGPADSVGPPAPVSARAATDTFLRHLVADRVDQAHELLCKGVQATYDRAAFGAYLEAHPFDSFSNPARGTPSSVPREPTGSPSVVSVEYYVLARPDRTKEMRGIPVVREGGRYRICGDPY